MKPNRRRFLRSSLATLGATTTAAAFAAAADDAPAASGNGVLDYGRSFITNTAAFNAVRFWVESRTTIIDEKSGESRTFYQCGSCKSEHTFAEKDLFAADNYDFLPILGDGDWLIFRRLCRISDRYRDVQPVDKLWGEPILKLRELSGTKLLKDWETIRDTTAAAVPIVAQTELHNAETGLRGVIEYPVKTMNISLDKQLYQVDTGPVAYPDLSQRFERPIEALSLAFVAFNAPDFADFVIEQPVKISEEAADDCQTYHYTKPFSMPAQNRLIAAAD